MGRVAQCRDARRPESESDCRRVCVRGHGGEGPRDEFGVSPIDASESGDPHRTRRQRQLAGLEGAYYRVERRWASLGYEACERVMR